MNPSSPGILASIAAAIGGGLPILLLNFATVLVLLVLGIAIYTALTPFREHRLIQTGNVAAGVVLAGAIVALALPLAALLSTTHNELDIIVWGVVAVLLQLLTMAVVTLLMRDLRQMIEAENIAAALVLAAVQITVGLMNAGAMIPS